MNWNETFQTVKATFYTQNYVDYLKSSVSIRVLPYI